MGSRHPLPVTDATPRTVDAVRSQLGGRAESLPGIGEIVAIKSTDHSEAGVVLFVSSTHFDVWYGGSQVRRTPRELIEPYIGDVSHELMVVASDARVFAALQEGERVRFSPGEDGHDEGTLSEKCRFGGLVLRDDGVMVGVGFQRLWPASETLPN